MIGFTSETVATFIGVVGILSILAQVSVDYYILHIFNFSPYTSRYCLMLSFDKITSSALYE